MNSNIDAIKMLKVMYKIQKLNTDLDWDSDEEPKITFSEEETTKLEVARIETLQDEFPHMFKKKNLGEF